MLSMTRPVGFENERKAFVLLVISLYVALFGIIALVTYVNGEPAWGRCFVAMALCYGIGFFSLASGWFWGRWYTIGLGYSGLTTAVWGMVTLKQIEPTLLIYGLTHGVMALFLQGERLVAQFDAKPGWREQLGLDEEAVYRIRKTVTRAVSSLPTLILFALAPRGQTIGVELLQWLVLPALLIGLYGILTLRVFGLISVAFTAISVLAFVAIIGNPVTSFSLTHSQNLYVLATHLNVLVILSTMGLLAAVIPFARPIAKYIRASSRAS